MLEMVVGQHPWARTNAKKSKPRDILKPDSGPISNGQAALSPDGSRIAYVQSDSSQVKLRPMLVPGDPTYPEVEHSRFARVGGVIASLRVGVVDASGGGAVPRSP